MIRIVRGPLSSTAFPTPTKLTSTLGDSINRLGNAVFTFCYLKKMLWENSCAYPGYDNMTSIKRLSAVHRFFWQKHDNRPIDKAGFSFMSSWLNFVWHMGFTHMNILWTISIKLTLILSSWLMTVFSSPSDVAYTCIVFLLPRSAWIFWYIDMSIFALCWIDL